MDTTRFRVAPDSRLNLDKRETTEPALRLDDSEHNAVLGRAVSHIAERQKMLFADGRHALLVVLQGMDASGKDGIVRHVFSGVNPAGCRVTSFKRPSDEELAHDFLWRTTRALPERGTIGVFNRSYYEEVVVVRVHPRFLQAQRLPGDHSGDAFWQDRYRSIRQHEAHLARSGTHVLKFFLHISPQEQKKRFLARIDEPDKHFKFTAADLSERAFWPQYREAYSRCIEATSTEAAPWYVVPADDKKVARRIVASVVAELLDGLDLHPPPLDDERRAALAAARAQLTSGG